MGDSVNDSARPEFADAELIFSEINPPTYQKWLNLYPTDLIRNTLPQHQSQGPANYQKTKKSYFPGLQ